MPDSASRPGRVLVLYASAAGNTAAMARLVGEGASSIPDTEVRVLSIQEATVDDLAWADGVALGSPTNLGTVAWEMKRWWDETAVPLWPKIDGKLGCAFTSTGGTNGGGELTCMTLLTILMNFGFLVFGVTDYVNPGETLHYGAVVSGAPKREGDKAICRLLGRRLAEWVHTLTCNRPQHAPANAEFRRTQ